VAVLIAYTRRWDDVHTSGRAHTETMVNGLAQPLWVSLKAETVLRFWNAPADPGGGRSNSGQDERCDPRALKTIAR
jgi:hypothetical protein